MVLQLREATRIIESAIAKAQELNVEISVAICNRDGHSSRSIGWMASLWQKRTAKL